jgi:hypothetical protein
MFVRFEARDGRDWIQARIPGTPDSTEREVTPADLENYVAEYEAFLDGRPPPRGTPLSAIDADPKVVEEYERLGVCDLETLDSMPETRRLPMFYALREKARAYLHDHPRELASMQKEIEALRALVAARGS